MATSWIRFRCATTGTPSQLSLIRPPEGKCQDKKQRNWDLAQESTSFQRGCTGTLEMPASPLPHPAQWVHFITHTGLGTCQRHQGAPRATAGACCHLQAMSGIASSCPALKGALPAFTSLEGKSVPFRPLSPHLLEQVRMCDYVQCVIME